ncbi:flagellar biosynthesis protein FlhF [Catenovulum adriaticum]|uniref:Flagellar biosynthesis protein FlhF n=1 Tax=Catenovulum adriaticum TaxID=2984846 RepID=A0ABY7ANE9_9ALTE|nr:flagellar biosynthesis protein FlhF [Catenovulum sp. TS8]WAJ71092.1 flagellar biosynthesis protein FlhF [Catenovulum sp. TS8]
MKIKRFVAKDIRAAMQEIKACLGPEAIIMSNTKVAEGVEVVAAVDEQPQPKVEQPAKAATKPTSRQAAYRRHNQPEDSAISAEEDVQVSDSLQSLLMRQATPEFKNQYANKQHAAARAKKIAQAVEQTQLDNHESINDWSLNHQTTQSLSNQTQQSTSNTGQTTERELQSIKSEMAELKHLLKHQVSGLMWQEMARSEPTRAYIVDRLTRMGIAAQVAEQVASFMPEGIEDHQAWDSALELLSGQINVTNNDIMRRGGVVALLGPTGVGKTTTVAKLAAHFAKKHGADSVALVTTDSYRIGAHEQLQTYARIIGCPCKVVRHEDELADTLHQLRNRKLILIDTAGVGQRDVRLAEQLDSLMRSTQIKIRNYLVLQATSQQSVLMETVQQFKRTNLTGCIFTKLDECMSLGEIISVAIQNALPIGYLTDGQRVPEDIKAATAQYLIDQAAGYMDENEFSHPHWFTDSSRQPIYK